MATSVMVFEPGHTGHRLAYARYVLDALSRRRASAFLLTTTEAARSSAFGVHLGSTPVRVEVIRDKPARPRAPIQDATLRTRWLVSGVLSYRPDHVFVPYADGISQLLGLLRPALWPVLRRVTLEGILMRGGFAYALDSRRNRAVARASRVAHQLAPWHRLHFIDEFAFEAYRTAGPSSVRAGMLPDPVEAPRKTDRTAARAALGLDNAAKYLVAAGELNERKGVDLLIDAVQKLEPALGVRLLLVGAVAPSIQQSIARPNVQRLIADGRIVIRDGYVSNQVFRDAIVAADAVCAPYRRHVGSASLVLHAAAACRFVIGSDWGWIGTTIRKHNLGATCANSAGDIAEVVTRNLPALANYTPAASARAFAEEHTLPRFEQRLMAILDARLGHV